MNGVNIQPINTWYNGEQIQINFFSQQIVSDNLSNSAMLEYFMINKDTSDPDNIIYTTISRGNLTINNPDYTQWDNDPNANDWIYNWSLQQLNLTQIP